MLVVETVAKIRRAYFVQGKAIKATGRVSWLLAIGVLGIAGVAVLATVGSGGAALPVTAPGTVTSALLASAALGPEAAAFAIGFVTLAGAGGVSLLKMLYSGYRIAEKGTGRVLLVRKSGAQAA